MIKKRKGFAFTMLLMIVLLLTSCDPLEIIYNDPAFLIDWASCYGGSKNDVLYDIIETEDNCYVGVGQSISNDGDLDGNNGMYDVWVIKFNQTGTLIWSKNYGGSDFDIGNAVLATNDGGYVVAGYSESNDIDVGNNYGGNDFWILRLDENGELVWEENYGGSENDYAHDICQTGDGGYVIAGYTASSSDDVIGFHGINDYWVIKIDDDGNLIWSKALGGSDSDRAYSVYPTHDNGFVVAGSSSSGDGNVSGNHGESDVWLVKLDQFGDIDWEKNYGGTQNDSAKSVKQTSNHGFIIAGQTFSNDNDVSGKHGNEDGWVVRTDINGNLKWAKCYGGIDYDEIKTILQTKDGGYAFLGSTRSSDGDVPDNYGGHDFLFMTLNEDGTIVRCHNYGGSKTEIGNTMIAPNPGHFILAGNTYSNDIDVSGHKGLSDYWVLSLELE